MSTVLIVIGLIVIAYAGAYYFMPEVRAHAAGWKASVMAVVGGVVAAVGAFFESILSLF